MPNQWLQEVKIEWRFGLWGVIDSLEVDGVQYALMEHNYYGDETACIVIKVPRYIERQTRKLKNGKTVTWIPEDNEICETFDDLKTTLIEERILKED